MDLRSIGLWGGALGFLAATSGASCSSSGDRPPPSGFGAPVGASGDSGVYHPPPLNRGGTSGRGGAGGSKTGGASGEDSQAGFGGESPGGAGAGGNRGGSGGKGGDGAGNLGARGGGGNETAEGGALLTGPDLDCPKLTPVGGASAPVCDPKAMWAAGVAVLTTPSGADELLAITPDELTAAWRYASEATGPTLYLADRNSADDEFATPAPVMDPAAAGVSEVALAPTRLRLVAVSGGQLIEFVRTATTDAFAYAGPAHFASIDLDASERSATLADPVLTADDSTVYYTLEDSSADGPTLQVAHRLANDDFAVGTPIGDCNLLRATSGVRRPTGISSDERTLFYYDEPLATERAAWRASPTAAFDTFVDLPKWSSVQPNAACDRIYYSTATDKGLEIMVSTQK